MSIFHKIQMAILYFGRAARRDASHMVGQAASPTRTMCVDVTLTPSKIKVKIKPGTQTWHSIPSFRFVPDFILSRSQRTITKTGEDHKGPQRSITKECKEPLGTARGPQRTAKDFKLGCHFVKPYSNLFPSCRTKEIIVIIIVHRNDTWM